MRYDQLIQLYFERSGALQGYWTLYVVVIGGLLAFSSIRKQRDVITAILVSALFCCFAYKNLDAIHDVVLQRQAVLQEIRAASSQEGTGFSEMNATLVSTDYDGVRIFHVASDALTLAAVWAMELRRWRASKKLGIGI